MAWYANVATDDVFYIQNTVLSIPNVRFQSCLHHGIWVQQKDRETELVRQRNFRIAESI